MVIQKKSPTWTDVKARLADFDRASLQGLVKDLYGASKDNQSFLHARFGLGADVLNPYKARIDRWLWPDLLKNQDVSASKAKKVVADYKKAIGRPEGLAELIVFYCERASDFSNAFGFADEAYFGALLKMFERRSRFRSPCRSISVIPCLIGLIMYEGSATTSGTGLAMKWIFS